MTDGPVFGWSETCPDSAYWLTSHLDTATIVCKLACPLVPLRGPRTRFVSAELQRSIWSSISVLPSCFHVLAFSMPHAHLCMQRTKFALHGSCLYSVIATLFGVGALKI